MYVYRTKFHKRLGFLIDMWNKCKKTNIYDVNDRFRIQISQHFAGL